MEPYVDNPRFAYAALIAKLRLGGLSESGSV